MNQDSLVYKFYNIDNELLYVGITNDMKIRLVKHKQDKTWFKEISKITVSNKLNRNESHIYEIYYIANEEPKYNIDFIDGGKINFTMDKLIFNDYIPIQPRFRADNKIVRSDNKINIDTVSKLYFQGKSIKQIGEIVNRSPYTIKMYLIELGLIDKQIIRTKLDRLKVLNIAVSNLKENQDIEYFMIEDIIREFAKVYDCTYLTAKATYNKEFVRSIQEILDSYGLVKITANKEIKEKYNINVSARSYPKIIIKKEE
jgi:hypothetical protein